MQTDYSRVFVIVKFNVLGGQMSYPFVFTTKEDARFYVEQYSTASEPLGFVETILREAVKAG